VKSLAILPPEKSLEERQFDSVLRAKLCPDSCAGSENCQPNGRDGNDFGGSLHGASFFPVSECGTYHAIVKEPRFESGR